MLGIAILFAMFVSLVIPTMASCFGEVTRSLGPDLEKDDIFDEVHFVSLVLFFCCLGVVFCSYIYMSIFSYLGNNISNSFRNKYLESLLK